MVKRTDEAAEFGLSLVTVRRTMAALEILADADASLSLSEIARRLDVNKNIALRILMTLEEENYIYRHVETKFYLAGFKVSTSACACCRATGCSRSASPCSASSRMNAASWCCSLSSTMASRAG